MEIPPFGLCDFEKIIHLTAMGLFPHAASLRHADYPCSTAFLFVEYQCIETI
jgi:hypothetical protein